MMGLTKRQRECLNFIHTEVKEKGVTPTLNQIAAGMGWKSKTVAHHCVTALQERGLVRRKVKTRIQDGSQFTANRGIELIEPEHDHGLDCPCASCPARRFQYQQLIESLQVPAKFANGIRLHGIRPLSNLTRLQWQRGFPAKNAMRNPAIPTEVRR